MTEATFAEPQPTAVAPVPAPMVTEPPAIPAGCQEPQWDAEHGFWHCQNSESPDG